MTSEKIQVRYFSGYIRNWKKLCTELGISCGLDRKEREKAIIEKAYEKWEMQRRHRHRAGAEGEAAHRPAERHHGG